mmetsp:Transcript_4019/g.5947  ORF Transcript_4019/g.5947 Transcript_4019/m.5947 type:complete len:169 (+) Transcript_4019:84-590(+)
MSGQEDTGTVKFISSDGLSYEVPFNAARMAKSIIQEDTLGDLGEDTSFQIVKVSSAILEKVINYCKHYQEEKMQDIVTPLKGEHIGDTVKPDWYVTYCEGMEFETLFKISVAANFMDIKPLLDMCCFLIGLKARGKSTRELCNIFHIPDPGNGGGGVDGRNSGDEAME